MEGEPVGPALAMSAHRTESMQLGGYASWLGGEEPVHIVGRERGVLETKSNSAQIFERELIAI